MRTLFAQRYVVFPILFFGALFGMSMNGNTLEYQLSDSTKKATSTTLVVASTTLPNTPPPFLVTHIPTPASVKSAYMTSCIASGKNLRAPLTKLVDTTEINALIIDIKDFSGAISFELDDSNFVLNTKGCVVPDMKEFIGELHKKNIYVIGRVTVMQDSVYPKAHPDAAVKKKSDGGIWKDKKGLMFIDPGATEYWAHMVALGKASYAIGFDEINYDYIRFPSDGNMSDAVYPRTGSTTKAVQMNKFYTYLGREMKKAGIPISADLFGMTTTNTDDLGIGQVLEDALRNFDYVAPMVYPSHYPRGFNGWKDPNLVPYELIYFVMKRAVERADAIEAQELGFVFSTSTPKFVATGKYSKKLRTWIQDFDYGKVYTEADVRAQKKGTYDAGVTSWMSWDPSNKYTPSAYNAE
jgi:hypothetical protein